MGKGLKYYFTHYGLNLDVVTRMVSYDNRTRILSSPIIMTMDNKKAMLDVATEKYFYKGSSYLPTSTAGYISQDQVDMKSVGLKLTVTPHINKSKSVSMEITQEFSDASQKQDVGKMGTWPIMSKNTFEASVVVKSGATIVLGGLSKETKGVTRDKIPILGDIPVLGLLFGSSNVDKERKEILVFITPYVMDNPDDIETDARRRQASLGDEGQWKKGWSDSALGTMPSKADLRKMKEKGVQKTDSAESSEVVQPAEKQLKPMKDTPKGSVERLNIQPPVQPVATNATQVVPVQQNTVTNGQNGATSNLDPELLEMMKRREKQFDRNLKKIDAMIEKEMSQIGAEKKP
jgi:Flp pilus assembly secretin CpaC